MSSSTGTRFSPITPDNHAGSIWITSLLCLIYSALVLSLRAHLRRRTYGTDDWLAAAATFFQVGEVVAVIVALKHGLGQSLPALTSGDRSTSSQATYAGQILFIVSTCLAKASTLWLMMRLFNLSGGREFVDRRSKMLWSICIALLSVMGAWGILSIVALCVDCSSHFFAQQHPTAQCANLPLRWKLITTFDVLTECLLVIVSIFIVWPVKLKAAMKFQVVLAFAFRLPLVMLSLLHMHYVSLYATARNPGLALVPVLVCQQTQLSWSLISATIPNLKAFVKSFSTGFGMTADFEAQTAYGKYGTGAVYELGSRNKSKVQSVQKSHGRSADREMQPVPTEGPQNGAVREDGSIESHGSQSNIIRRDFRWDVSYENA